VLFQRQNEFNGRERELYLIDFGSAVYEDLQKGQEIGSVIYMSYEVLEENDHTIHRDIWAVGIIISYLVYRSSPFDGPKSQRDEIKLWLKDVIYRENIMDAFCKNHEFSGFPCDRNCKFIRSILWKLLCKVKDRLSAAELKDEISTMLKN